MICWKFSQVTRQRWLRTASCIMFAVWLAFFCQAADPKKPLHKPPIPVKVVEVYPLPFFCVAEGLEEGKERAFPQLLEGKYVPGTTCSPSPTKSKQKPAPELRYIVVSTGNADEIATQLQPQFTASSSGNATVTAAAAVTGTATATASGAGSVPPNQFALTATADKRAEIIFCRDRECPEPPKRLENAIKNLARPKYAYFKDYPIDSVKAGKALAKAVPVINVKLSAEVIDSKTLRVESAKPLTTAEVSVFEERLIKDQAAVVERLIKTQTALASASDSGASPGKETLADLKGADPDSQVIAVNLPYFCQADDLTTLPERLDKDDTCASPLRRVQANNFDAIVQAVNAALSKSSSKLSLSKDGTRILIACDGKCSGDAFEIAQSTIALTARPVPLFVHDIEVPRGTAHIAAVALSVAPMTATALTETRVRIGSDTPIPDNDLASALERVREIGFGDKEIPPFERMFYRSAADVIGSLLSTPSPPTPPSLGGNAANAPVTGNSASGSTPASSSSQPSGSSITINPAPAATAAAPVTGNSASGNTPASSSSQPSGSSITISTSAPASAPAPGPAPTGTVGLGMTSVDDSVVFTDTSSPPAMQQRIRLLTLLDIPRPEVLMNLWSFQASSPDGKEMALSLQKARDLVNANNDALQHAIDYGWAYLSRKMQDPAFFDADFHDYLTNRFVADTTECEAHDPKATGCLTDKQRSQWGLCAEGQYCLGYEGTFQPVRPNLTNILLGMMAAKDTPKVVLTTIGCMEGKFEVYPECFPNRKIVADSIANKPPSRNLPEPTDSLKACLIKERAKFLNKEGAGAVVDNSVMPMTDKQKKKVLSCEILDRAAVEAQKACGLPVTLPLSCFTIQAAKSLLPDNSFSTFNLQQLNSLAEKDLANIASELSDKSEKYSATSVGLLRSSVADFLFNYKMAEQFPNEFSPYFLRHTAQELNAEFNPLVVAFNQDVAALSRTLMDEIQKDVPNQNHCFQLLRHNKSYIADGMMTVRGISGVESLVDTDTQNAFDATQAQSLNAILNSITGGNGTALSDVGALFKGSTTSTGIATALAAITPVKTHAMIGRQLTLDVIPHTLPGASAAELELRLWAQEDSAPTIYSESGSNSNDYVSRVARHNVATRVRVESVKLFDVSTFTALVQRPRAKLPIVPPLIEIPLISSILSVPLPAAKIYHSSSAIVSAVIVPTAADLAYGLQFTSDKAVFPEDRRYSHSDFSLRVVASPKQIPKTTPIWEYHAEMIKCLAANRVCREIRFSSLAP